MSAEREACVADLEMVVERLRDLFGRLREECELHGASFTPKQEGKWEGGFLAIRGVLVDELGPMLATWKRGEPFSRKGEEILNGANERILATDTKALVEEEIACGAAPALLTNQTVREVIESELTKETDR